MCMHASAHSVRFRLATAQSDSASRGCIPCFSHGNLNGADDLCLRRIRFHVEPVSLLGARDHDALPGGVPLGRIAFGDGTDRAQVEGGPVCKHVLHEFANLLPGHCPELRVTPPLQSAAFDRQEAWVPQAERLADLVHDPWGPGDSG
eukprot:CAMPEP_0175241554 /NCGR_PEP_ID=MMETSP0093-20121207/30619_1 /TAXON_ID=311494 /ORGANISM="Alexandrium monilatum, Strain CCMP3105" /LENGTH=146 /DNA_ID=CAMNT_0016535615 /DNA_START=26 /DNA_END=466 /DNA_ORIENTATION=-